MTTAQNKGRAAPTNAKVAVVEEHSAHLLSGVSATVGYTVECTPRDGTYVLTSVRVKIQRASDCKIDV